MTDEKLPRALELLADEALQGLCPDEWAELDRLEPPSPAREATLRELELLAASVALSETEPVAMPPALSARLAADFERSLEKPPRVATTAPEPRLVRPRREPSYLGWAVAAATAIGFWLMWPTKPAEAPVAQKPVEAPAKVRSLSDERDALLGSGGAHQIVWSPTKDETAAHATGDVVWNAKERKGIMRFHGLAKNDRTRFQYQLWIFDKQRDERHPVDGGVFDITSDGDVLVQIDARLPVHEATLFAITVEPPGGVVVSTRERIVLTAALEPI